MACPLPEETLLDKAKKWVDCPNYAVPEKELLGYILAVLVENIRLLGGESTYGDG